MGPIGSSPIGDRQRRGVLGPSGYAGPDRSAQFYAVEIEARLPGTAAVPEARGIGGAPIGAIARRLASREHTTTIRASDAGYRTRPSDVGGVVVYPAMLDTAFALDRILGLAPTQANASISWGRTVLVNADRRWDSIAALYNADGRRVRVLAGRKTWDDRRGLWVDPPFTAMQEVFAGIAQPWSLSETALTIPLRDISYWLERPLHTNTYAGTGGYEGTADMAGRVKPILRGGTGDAPVRQVTPVLVDPVDLIYQFADGPGAVVTLREAGDPTNILPGGDVADLYAGSTPPGRYRTCTARGMFQLGSRPAGAITVDVCSGTPTAAGIAREIIAELQVPPGFVDEASFIGLAAAWPQPCGWWWGEEASAAEAVNFFLGSIGARLITTRTGQLRAVPLAVLPTGIRPAAVYTPDQILSVEPVELGAPLAPSPAAWQVGHSRNHTVQTSDMDPDLDATAAAALGQEWRQEGAANPDVLLVTRTPSLPPMLQSAHLTASGAQALAGQLRDLWCLPRPRRAFRVTLPDELTQRHEIGTPLVIAWPADDLDAGRLCQVVGDSIQPGSETGVITVLT